MKKIAIAILALIVLTTGVMFVFSQKRGQRGAERGFGGPGFLLGKIADEIGLSEEQRSQVKQILEAEKPKAQALMETARETHEQLTKLGTDGTYNEAQVAELAARQAETTRQMIVEKEKTKAAIFALLTAEQRVKAAELHAKFKERMGERFGRRGFGGGFPKEF